MKNTTVLATLLAAAALADNTTDYDLTLFSEPGYKAEAVEVRPTQCMLLKNHDIDSVKSIRFSGNNACLFFPSCDRMDLAQTVMGDIPDVGVWGFPNGIGAVKCLSHAAADVIRHYGCAFNATCGPALEQGQCPFEQSCTEYKAEMEDQARYAEPLVDPVQERFQVPDVTADVAAERKKTTRFRPAVVPGHMQPGKTETSSSDNSRSTGSWEGGSDDYSEPWKPVPAEPKDEEEAERVSQQQYEKAKEDKKQARKEARRKYREQKAYERALAEKARQERKTNKDKSSPKAKALQRIKDEAKKAQAKSSQAKSSQA